MTVILYREFEFEDAANAKIVEMRCIGEHESKDAIRDQPDPDGSDFAVFESVGELNELGLPKAFEFAGFVRGHDNTNAPGPNITLRKTDAKAKLKKAKAIHKERKRIQKEHPERYGMAGMT